MESKESSIGLPPEITKRKEIDLSNQVAIVTGASKGIGRAIAETLAQNGASLVINSRESSRDNAEEVLSKIKSFGGKGIWVPGDIVEENTQYAIFQKVIEEFGRLDILINNAGSRHDGLLVRTSDEEFMRVLKLNLISSASMTREAVKQMLRQRPQGGNIVFIGSLATLGSPGQSLYAAAKAGLEGFVKSLAPEYGKRNIKSNVVSPGLVDTDMVKDLSAKGKQAILDLAGMKRALKPEEVAGAVLQLLSKDSTHNGKVFYMKGD